MVHFVDLDDDPEPPELARPRLHAGWTLAAARWPRSDDRGGSARPNPNQSAMTQALGCYPIIVEIAASLDLNSLDSLARSCRQVRENLLQFRAQLLRGTLRCDNDAPTPPTDLLPASRDGVSPASRRQDAGRTTSWRTGTRGPCARDLVAECRRCRRMNCTTKPLPSKLWSLRHRRLCRKCSKAPIAALVAPHLPSLTFHDETLRRELCACGDGHIWLCRPCGQSLRSDDDTYVSIWRWRTAYGPSLLGLGVGIGEGNRGVGCGRETHCLAAREVEEEIDCDAADAREIEAAAAALSLGDAADSSLASSPGALGPGYSRHEIEGIGGVVKTKLVRMVKVGACVVEYPDECEVDGYLRRERAGVQRSWCGWCARVIPSVKDKA